MHKLYIYIILSTIQSLISVCLCLFYWTHFFPSGATCVKTYKGCTDFHLNQQVWALQRWSRAPWNDCWGQISPGVKSGEGIWKGGGKMTELPCTSLTFQTKSWSQFKVFSCGIASRYNIVNHGKTFLCLQNSFEWLLIRKRFLCWRACLWARTTTNMCLLFPRVIIQKKKVTTNSPRVQTQAFTSMYISAVSCKLLLVCCQENSKPGMERVAGVLPGCFSCGNCAAWSET